ncbi:MAG: hypothetical protein KIT47_20585, partial [Rhodoferax sp.]|nr:hypothetical protein [Rhodoferax sp.]
MSRQPEGTHVDPDRLLAYWLEETDAAETDAIDMHLLACDSCGAALDQLVALSHGVKRAFAGGLVHTFVTAAFVGRLRARGLRVREYHVPVDGSVNCSVSANDDVLIGRMAAPLDGVRRVDAALRMSPGEDETWVHDIPFDPATGEVVIAPALAQVRQLPS